MAEEEMRDKKVKNEARNDKKLFPGTFRFWEGP